MYFFRFLPARSIFLWSGCENVWLSSPFFRFIPHAPIKKIPFRSENGKKVRFAGNFHVFFLLSFKLNLRVLRFRIMINEKIIKKEAKKAAKHHKTRNTPKNVTEPLTILIYAFFGVDMYYACFLLLPCVYVRQTCKLDVCVMCMFGFGVYTI